MFRTSCNCLAMIIVLLGCTMSFAVMKSGRVVALTLQQGDEAGNWAPGKLTLIDIPSLQKTALVDKNCWGPCFSPNSGDTVAYVTTGTDGNYYIYTLAIGGSAQPVSTGIKINMTPPNDWGWAPGAHPALFWIRMSDGDWFYWVQRVTTGCGVFRAKLGTSTTPEFVYGTSPTNALGFHWGAFDKTATHVVATQNWGVYKIDLVSRTHTKIDDGCNPAVSPSGNLMMNNGGSKNCDPSPLCNYEHCGGQILNWVGFTCSAGLVYPGNAEVACNGDMNKWSHYDEDIIMFRAFDQYGQPEVNCTVADHGVIAHRITKERLSLGPYVGWDFFPGTVGPDTTTREPTFNPASGTLNAGTTTVTLTSATAGATIRYTTDGSAPTTTHGTSIASGGTLPVTLTVGQSIRVRAIAYATGRSPSIITEANYSVPVPTTSITITSPNGGESYRAGDSVTITWTIASGFTPSGFIVQYSLDGGLSFTQINSTNLPANSRSYRWRIPAGTPPTTEALIEIHDYTASNRSDVSNTFNINPLSAIGIRGSAAASSGFSIHREGRQVVVNHASLNSVSILDARGKTVGTAFNATGGSMMKLRLPASSGAYLLMIRTADGTYQRMIPAIGER